MLKNRQILRIPDTVRAINSAPVLVISLLMGVIMPMVAAWFYPTYTNTMSDPFVEWTRLQEVPFVVCEALIVGWALYRGMELRCFASILPRDCLIASGIFMAGLWGSTLFVSKIPATSLMISLSTVVHILFALSVYHLAGNAKKTSVEQFASVLALGLFALAVLTAFRFLTVALLSPVPGNEIEWSSAMPGFISVRHFGSWTGAITAIFAAILLNNRDDAALSRIDLFFFLSMAMTIWSGTRAAVLAIAISCAIMVVSKWQMPSLRMFGRLSMTTGAAAFLALALIPYGNTAFLLFEYWDTNPIANADQISSGRLSLWGGTYEKWLEAPWFGWGSGSTFWEVFELNWTHTQPHNFILQFLISWGLVGAVGAIWLLARTTAAAHRRVMANTHTWPLLVGLYSLLVMALLEGMLHYPRFIMLIMALLALILRLTSDEHASVRRERSQPKR
ncbi:MAG: O-antigen ligase family protein [Sphingorhabdus sp.]